jgi:hypothetical protein
MWYRIKQFPHLAQGHPFYLALYGVVLLLFGTCAEITLLSYFSLRNRRTSPDTLLPALESAAPGR